MTEQEIEILVHRAIGSWAIDYRVPLTQAALDAIEGTLQQLITNIIQRERERCERETRR